MVYCRQSFGCRQRKSNFLKFGLKEADSLLPFSALCLWEDNLRKGLVSASVQDSSLTALTILLGECSIIEGDNSFRFHQEIDATAVRVCLSALFLTDT